MAMTACDKVEELFDDEEEVEQPYTSPYEEYDSTATAMILKYKTVPAEGLYGTGEKDNPYLIRNAPELKYFINAVSNGSLDTWGKYFRLTNDITVDKSYHWYPVGGPQEFHINTTECYSFNGLLDGAGHTLKGCLIMQPLQCENSSMMHFGLFYSVCGSYDDYSIKDLTVDADVVIATGSVSDSETLGGSSTRVSIGLLASSSVSGGRASFRNCHINSNVTFEFDWRVNEMRIGGFCGSSGWSEFHNCSFSGSIDMDGRIAAGSLEVGGLVAAVTERITFNNCVNSAHINADGATCVQLVMGGICGDYGMQRYGGEHYWFINCRNKGDISSTELTMQMANNSVLVGGIVGQMWDSFNNDERAFSNCENSGNMTIGSISRGDETSDDEAQPWFCMGGLVGQDLNGIDFESCTNTGNVTAGTSDFGPYAYSHTGGIAGYTSGSMTSCRSTGNITGMEFPEEVLIDGYVFSPSEATGTASYVGGLAGSYGDDPIHECYTEGDMVGTFNADESYVGTLVGCANLYAGVEPFVYSCTSSMATIHGKLHDEEYRHEVFLGNSKFFEKDHYMVTCGAH